MNSDSQKALREWLDQSKINSGRLFRAITLSGRIKESLNSAQINRIYKRLANKALIDTENVKKISGHSIRVGAAQDLLSAGKTFPEIMQRGRWSKIDTVIRYIENIH